MNPEDYKAIAEIISIRNNVLKGNFIIAKECYEERFSSQRYANSILHNTYGVLMGAILNKLKKEISLKLADYFKTRQCRDQLEIIYQMDFDKKRFLRECGVQ